MNLRKYLVPEFIIGDNSLALVGNYAKNFGAKKILIVTDKKIIKAGWLNEVTTNLERVGLKYSIFDDLTPNPKDYQVMAGADMFKKENCNIIVALGGGSVIDCAKGIGIVFSNKKHINSYEGVDKVQIPMPPLICIPTTAGSAADISQFSIILNTDENRKIAIISKSVVPDISLIDAITTTTMDLELTVASGIDALVHAIEAYVSNASSPVTDLNAIQSIALISKNLPKVVKEPSNIIYRHKMMLGSLLAGMAFSNASLGLVHAMSHSLGGLYDISHGETNAILLEHCIDYNFDSCIDRYRDIYLALEGAEPVEDELLKQALIDYFVNFRKSLNIDFSGSRLNINDFVLKLAENAFADPCLATNPKDISIEQIKAIYERIF